MSDALTEAMAIVRTATPQQYPWRAVDISGDGDDPTPIDAAIAEILNAVADGRLVRADLGPQWHPIATAPREADVLVWFDHDADPYQDSNDPTKLTDYAVWVDGGDFLDGKGFAIARRLPQHWEAVDEYGAGYWLPAAWFSCDGSGNEYVVNPTHWMALPSPPQEDA